MIFSNEVKMCISNAAGGRREKLKKGDHEHDLVLVNCHTRQSKSHLKSDLCLDISFIGL